MNRLTVSGLPGTGTSTLCKLLAAATNLDYVYAGALFRQEAESRGMSLAEFGALCQQDPAVDKALDAKQAQLLAQGPVLLEGRLSGWLANRDSIPSLRVLVTCEDEERIRRLCERDGLEAAVQEAAMRQREDSEADRYKRYYGVNPNDPLHYNLILDSTHQSPEDLTTRVQNAWRAL